MATKTKKKAIKPKEQIYANRIREILTETEMSSQELADITGIDTAHLSRIINGKRKCISLPIAMKLSEALKRPVEQVFIYKNAAKTPANIEDDLN